MFRCVESELLLYSKWGKHFFFQKKVLYSEYCALLRISSSSRTRHRRFRSGECRHFQGVVRLGRFWFRFRIDCSESASESNKCKIVQTNQRDINPKCRRWSFLEPRHFLELNQAQIGSAESKSIESVVGRKICKLPDSSRTFRHRNQKTNNWIRQH